jgi:DMSO/TMAO reductase YedYZ molybdopterin-dependent catalytic subunit
VVAHSALALLPRVEQVSDLHCVTTWSYCRIRWGGYRFCDVYERLFLPRVKPHREGALGRVSGGRWTSGVFAS